MNLKFSENTNIIETEMLFHTFVLPRQAWGKQEELEKLSNQCSYCAWTVDKWKLFLATNIWPLLWVLPLEMNVLRVHTEFHTKQHNLENPATQGNWVVCKLAISFWNWYALWLPLGPCNENLAESLHKI